MTDASKTASNFRQDSDGPAATPPKSPWQYISRVRALLFPIEILFLLFLFLLMCFQQIGQQYFFQRYARDALANISDFENDSNFSHVCLKQDDIVNITGSNESFLDIQIKTNNLNMYCEVITLGLSGIMSLFLGTISDRVGRKPILLLDVTGILICIIIQVVIIELELDLRYFLISNVFYGCCGGLGAILGVSFAAVADATKSKRLLAIRMGILESMIGVAKLAAYPTINYWINNNGCEFRYPAYFMIGMGAILAIYALCWPESIDSSQTQSISKGFQKILNGAKIYLIPSYTGIFTWCKIWIVTAILSLACLSAIGIVEITNYFLHNKPLQWSYDLIGIYGIVNSIAGLIGLSLLLPVLVLIGLPNPLIAIIGAVFGITSNVLAATVKSTWEMFIAGIFQGMQQLPFPPMRATLSSLVKSEDYGSVLSVTASIQMLASVCSTIAFNELYRPQITIKGTSLDPSIVFWITAGVWGAIIPLSLLLFLKKRKPHSIQLVDEKTLLSSDAPGINYQGIK